MHYIILFLLILITQLVYFRIADHFNIIDKPNERSSHTYVTLLGGGIIFYFSILFYFLFQGFLYPWFLVGLTLIAGVSFADDIKTIPTKWRLLVQFVAVAFMVFQLGIFQMPIYFVLVAIILFTGVLNAFNFMDGINGITGGYSLVVILSLWYINNFQIAFIENDLIISVLMALLVFNYFNFRKKAKCFAGDVGAITIAFIIVFLLGKLILKTNDFSYIVLIGFYGVDTVCTLVHRLVLKENIFQAHRRHMYQLMANELKMPHTLVSAIYSLVQAAITVGLVLSVHHYWYMLIVLPLLGISYIIFMMKYYRLYQKNA